MTAMSPIVFFCLFGAAGGPEYGPVGDAGGIGGG